MRTATGTYEVTVQVSDGANAVTADLEVTLQDVVATVTVAADAATIEEGEAAVFTVTRAGDLSGVLTVAVVVGETGMVLASGGSGTKQVSFADGTRTATLSVATEDDATPEPGGTVTAAVQTGTGYLVGTPGSAEVTVLDNDASTLTLTATPQEVAEDANATDVTVTVAWAAGQRAAATELTVEVGRSGDAATEGTDYTAVDDLTLTIDAGAAETSGTFELEPKDDAVDESDESLTVTTALTGLTVTPASVSIRDDDERGIVVQPKELTITEGENDRYTVVLSSQPTGTVTVSPSVSGNGDVSVSAESLTFTGGNWSTAQAVTVTVAKDGDAVVEPAAVIGHQGSGGDYGAETASVTVTVVEADTPTLTIADGSGREDAGTLAFVVSLSVASSDEVTVRYATADGTGTDAATAGSDYTRASGTLTFAAESTAATIAVTIGDDDEAEAAEKFTVTLSAAQHATIARATATGTITDDDAASPRFRVAENETAVGTVEVDDSDVEDSVTSYTLSGGVDRGLFDLDTSTGELTFKAPPNYEEPQDVLSTTPANDAGNNEYVLEVSVISGSGERQNTTRLTVVVTVTDTVERPGEPAPPMVTAASAISLWVTWTPPANTGPPITDYDYRYRPSMPSQRSRSLDSPDRWTEVVDTEMSRSEVMLDGVRQDTEYDVSVRAKNAEGTGPWSDTGTGPRADNAAPAFTAASASFTVAENETAVGTVAAEDTDVEDDVTGYELSGGVDAALFDLDGSTGELTFKVAPNYEDPQDVLSTAPANEAGNNEYVLEVSATSGSGETAADHAADGDGYGDRRAGAGQAGDADGDDAVVEAAAGDVDAACEHGADRRLRGPLPLRRPARGAPVLFPDGRVRLVAGGAHRADREPGATRWMCGRRTPRARGRGRSRGPERREPTTPRSSR